MKRILLLFLCIVLLAVPVWASQRKIVDNADLLTDSQERTLEEQASKLEEVYRMDAVILTIHSLDGQAVERYADDYYDQNGYGCGTNGSGVLLLLAMDTREWTISTCGDAIFAITDYGTEEIFSEIAPWLSEDDYYTAFSVYLDQLERYFEAYLQDNPIDGDLYEYEGPGTYIPATREDVVYYDRNRAVTPGRIFVNLLIALLIGGASGGVVLLILRRSMNTARPQRGAVDYMNDGSFRLNHRQDIFLNSHVSRTPRNRDSGGGHGGHGGGGSSVHRSSGGRSHGGGHGRF